MRVTVTPSAIPCALREEGHHPHGGDAPRLPLRRGRPRPAVEPLSKLPLRGLYKASGIVIEWLRAFLSRLLSYCVAGRGLPCKLRGLVTLVVLLDFYSRILEVHFSLRCSYRITFNAKGVLAGQYGLSEAQWLA